MGNNRRTFLRNSTLGALGGAAWLNGCAAPQQAENPENGAALLDEALAQPVLKRELFPDPLLIESLELLRLGDNFLCRVRAKGGAEGISVSNNMQMVALWPIFTQRLQPFFIGKDARDWEKLLEEVYVYQSNYKLQGLAFWVPLATIEFAVLDLLGKVANRPIGQLIGEIHHAQIAVYQANGSRGKSPEETIELIRQDVEASQAKALKFKLGGRMSKNAETPAGRTEKLIPLVRQTFGDDMVIYADSNGSYTVDEAIRIGKLTEEYRFDFYEEPVPFDQYEETRQVADALQIKIAGGEQEPSLWNFRWMIKNNALQVVQPDIFYFGGMIRSMQVARMAATKGIECTPHISGSGLGYIYMMHFVSAVPNAGAFHEFKGYNNEIPLNCPTSSLQSEGGVVTVPTGPGLGIEIDPNYIAKHEIVS